MHLLLLTIETLKQDKMYELIELITDRPLQEENDNSCIDDFYKSDNFEAYFENGNEDEWIRIHGTYELEIEEEDNSMEEDTRNVFYIDRIKFNDLTIYMNDVKVNLQLAELQSLLNDVENKIIKHFDF